MSAKASLARAESREGTAEKAGTRAEVLTVITSALIFWLDAVAVKRGWTASADRTFELAIHVHGSAAWHGAMQAASNLGQLGPVAAAGVGIAAVAYRRWSTPLAALPVAAPVVSSLLEGLLKLAFQRPRPHLWAAAAAAPGYSFPSGHATSSMAFAAACSYVASKTMRGRTAALMTAAFLLFALVVGFSRVYLGVHWPSDIIGGYCVAVGSTSVLALAGRWKAPGRETDCVGAGNGA